MTSLREAIARAIVSAGYNPATAPAIADAVLAILPDAEALAEALKYARAELWEALHSDMTEKQFEKQFGEIDAALANYRKGTGREG